MARLLFALIAFVGLLVWGAGPQAQDTRQFYTTPPDGTGTETDPWHSRCLGMPGAGNIDLRPDVDAFLCASNDLPSDLTGVEILGASFTSALGHKKNKIEAKFKKTLQATTVEELIVEVISPKLKAGKDGKLKIYLGAGKPVYQQTAWVPFRDNGLVADLSNAALGLVEPALAWAASISEAWTGCGDNASLTCALTWTEFNGTDWAIVSNQAAASTTSGQDEARADSALASDAHWAQATLITASSDATGTTRCGVIARKDSGATRTFYAFHALSTSGAFSSYNIDKRVAGTLSAISNDGGNPVANEVMKIYVDGSSISGYVDGVLRVGPSTDTSITANTYTGLSLSWNGTGSMGCTLDNFSAQDIASPSRARGGAIWFN